MVTEKLETNPNLYHQLKKLTGLLEWKTFVGLLEERKRRLYLQIESDENVNLKKIQTQLMEINNVIREPQDIVTEYEEFVLENKTKK